MYCYTPTNKVSVSVGWSVCLNSLYVFMVVSGGQLMKGLGLTNVITFWYTSVISKLEVKCNILAGVVKVMITVTKNMENDLSSITWVRNEIVINIVVSVAYLKAKM